MTRKERFERIIAWFQEHRPEATTELHYDNAFHLLIAVILSAQCTDKRVNLITPKLLQRYPTPEKMAQARQEEILEYIKSCSYPNSKARYLKGMARGLVEHFGGKVPSSVNDLQKLPGVGRKTANVIASVIFNQPAMAVDTHVFRVSARLGLTRNAKTPEETERQLVQYIPEDLIPKAHHWLILHGRYVCLAHKPKCEACGLKEFCKYYIKNHKND
ncbi:MAG: endonuclease III [Bacteroidales bacterium]|nr:endonuclease III [Bacteroidales bacterium]